MKGDSMNKPRMDILYAIDARLSSGRDRGAPQLNKDIRVLRRAGEEITRLRTELAAAQAHKFFCITELRRVEEVMLSEVGIGVVDQRIFDLTESAALDAAIESAMAMPANADVTGLAPAQEEK